MKNFKLFLLAMCLWASNVFGQKYFFKQEYAPNSEYEIQMTIVSDSEMKLFYKKEKQSVKMIQEMKMGMNILTDKKEENKIPFMVKYSDFDINIKMNGKELGSKENPFFGSMEAIGVIENGNRMSIIDVKGKNINEEIRQMIKNQSSQMAQFAVDFPEEGMMIGDSFTKKIPYHMKSPQGIDVVMEMTMHYKLIKVEGENADFDTTLEMDMKIGNDKMKIVGKAEGQGKSVFNTKINQFSKMDSDMQMRMTMDMGEIGKMTTLSDTKTTMQTKKLK